MSELAGTMIKAEKYDHGQLLLRVAKIGRA